MNKRTPAQLEMQARLSQLYREPFEGKDTEEFIYDQDDTYPTIAANSSKLMLAAVQQDEIRARFLRYMYNRKLAMIEKRFQHPVHIVAAEARALNSQGRNKPLGDLPLNVVSNIRSFMEGKKKKSKKSKKLKKLKK